MSGQSEKKTIECQFDSFCKKVLKNETADYYKHLRHKMNHEAQRTFEIMGVLISVNDDNLVAALSQLSRIARDIVLLYYFVNMNDKDIAKSLDMIRQTLQYQRNASLKVLKDILEDYSHDN